MSDLELNQLVMQKKYDEIVLVAILGGTHERLNKKSNKDLLVKQLTLIAKYADSDMVGAYAVIMLHCLGAMSRIEAMEILVSLNVEDIDYNVLDYDCDRLLMVILKEADREDYDLDGGLAYAQQTIETILEHKTNIGYASLGLAEENPISDWNKYRTLLSRFTKHEDYEIEDYYGLLLEGTIDNKYVLSLVYDYDKASDTYSVSPKPIEIDTFEEAVKTHELLDKYSVDKSNDSAK